MLLGEEQKSMLQEIKRTRACEDHIRELFHSGYYLGDKPIFVGEIKGEKTEYSHSSVFSLH